MSDNVESATIWTGAGIELVLSSALNCFSENLDDAASDFLLVRTDKHSAQLQDRESSDSFHLEWTFELGHKLVQLNLVGPVGRLSREHGRQRQLRDNTWLVYDRSLVFVVQDDSCLLISRHHLSMFDAQLECIHPLPLELDSRNPIPSDFYDQEALLEP